LKKFAGRVRYALVSVILAAYSYVPGQKLTLNGTDPTESRSRIDIFIAEATLTSVGNVFVTRITADYAVTPKLSFGMGIPFIYTEYNDQKNSGISDLELSGIFVLHDNSAGSHKYRRTAIGLNAGLPTGDFEDGEGEGKVLFNAWLAVSFFPDDFYMITPLVEDRISYAGKSEAKEIHEIKASLKNVFVMVPGHWVEITPIIIWDLLGLYEPAYLLSASLGYMINDNWALSADFTAPLAGETTFNSIDRLSVRYLFK
jgi:hypothetical protein